MVAERAGHCCEYCLASEAIFNFPFEVEHIVPTCRGGADQRVNWALSCRACNLYKGDHLEAMDPESRTLVPLVPSRGNYRSKRDPPYDFVQL
jgi:5-methylcytosine-specific restriction endonuclease McrA